MISIPDPAAIATCPPEQLPGLMVRLSALLALVAARLAAEPATVAPPADVGLLDAKDAAALLKVPVAAVYEAARRGMLGCVRTGNRGRRFTRQHVADFVKARSQAARR